MQRRAPVRPIFRPPSREPDAARPVGPAAAHDPLRVPNSPAAAAAAALEQFSLELAHFRREFERFFAGDLHRPPEELHIDLVSRLHRLRNGAVRSVADNFRLGNLEAQFNTYNEMFRRRLRDREEGPRGARAAALHSHAAARESTSAPAQSPRRAESNTAPPLDPRRGISVGDRLDREALEVLHRDLYPAAGAGVRSAPDLDRFSRYLETQIQEIRRRTGCRSVMFRVADEDGRLRLKAKPLDSDASS